MGQHEVLRGLVVADVEDLLDLLVGLHRQEVRRVLTLGVTAGFLQLVRHGPVHAALVGEEEQPVVRRRHEEVLDDVVRAELGAADPTATAVLRAVLVAPRALHVATRVM